MKCKSYIILTLLLLYCIRPLVAQEKNFSLKFRGFADTYHAVRSKSTFDFMSSRSRLRTEIEAEKGRSYLFASLNSVYNSLDNSKSKIELREAYLQYSGNNWDIKTGKQIITWGVADGLRVTDLISPMDYSEFLARDYDDIRIAVNALRLKYIKPNYNLELLLVPVSEFFVLPTGKDDPWSLTGSVDVPTTVSLGDVPEHTLKNSEFGGRFSFYLSGIDFSVSALHTWNKMPVIDYAYSVNMDSLSMNGHYDRLDMLGLDLSIPVGQFVIRAEMAAYLNELIAYSANTSINKNTINVLLGIDWYPGNEWSIMAQYYHRAIGDYNESLAIDKNTSYSTFGLSKKVFRSTLNLVAYTYFDLINKAFFARISADYSLSDQIHLMAGYDWFHGDKGMFSYYKENSEFWVKAKFNF